MMKNDESPFDSASLWSRLTFSFVNNIFERGNKRTLQFDDIPNIPKHFKSERVATEFEKHVKYYKSKPQYKFWFLWAIWSVIWPDTKLVILPWLFKEIALLSSPVFIGRSMRYLQSNEPDWNYWLLCMFGLMVSKIVQCMLRRYHNTYSHTLRLKIRCCIETAVYGKLLKLSVVEKQKLSSGEISTLLQRHVRIISSAADSVLNDLGSIIRIVTCFILIYRTVGLYAMVAGFFVLLIIIPINKYLQSFDSKLRRAKRDAGRKRIGIISEVISSIRLIKYFAWEKLFLKRVQETRDKEYEIVRKSNLAWNMLDMIWEIVPSAIALACFSTFTLLGNSLTPAIAFSFLALLETLTRPLYSIPRAVSRFHETRESAIILQRFLSREEKIDTDIVQDVSNDICVDVRDGDFSWGGKKILSDVNFRVKKGQLVAIVGKVGCGKSSLISALLGEMQKIKGNVFINASSFAYASQIPTVLNMSLKDNILFGSALDKKKFEEVIECCALTDDIGMLPAKEETEIGEKGITLSGGQQSRVNLARACYNAMPDSIVLLDDPLSSVDSLVGHHIFEKAIMGYLGRCTRILVTHHVHLLTQADMIYCLKDGKIESSGTYDELLQKSDEFAQLVKSKQQAENVNKKPSPTTKQFKLNDNLETEKGVLTAETTTQKDWSVLFHYIKTCGMWSLLGMILLGFGSQGCKQIGNWWVSHWSSQTKDVLHNPIYYAGIYLLISIATSIVDVVRPTFSHYATMNAAKIYHDEMLQRVVQAKVEFFDKTPVGTIVSRFGEDLHKLDLDLAWRLRELLVEGLSFITNLGLIIFVSPLSILLIIPIAKYLRDQVRYYAKAYTDIARMEHGTRAKGVNHANETLNALIVIRAFKAQKYFIKLLHQKLNHRQKLWFYSAAMDQWWHLRLDLLTSIVIFSSSVLGVLFKNQKAETLGLLITYCNSLVSSLGWILSNIPKLEASLTSLENIQQFFSLDIERYDGEKVDSEWPSKPSIVMENIVMRYRKELDPVLKNITLEIKPGEKIGIVGRTGAGKSSLIQVLFRMREIEHGKLIIDGKDITSIDLTSLRSSMSIIPQQPTLFKGSLRSNLDPFNEYTEQQLWESLEKVNLADKIRKLPQKLLTDVAANGENFSAGERQLICLARAILKKSKILFMDESTANIDNVNNLRVQKAIKQAFKGCTLLIIAHRLDTVMDCDRVLVLEDGRVAEFDTPKQLIKMNGKFAQLLTLQSTVV